MAGADRNRAARVAEAIKIELADLVAREIKDPRVRAGLVTVSHVEVNRDLSVAEVGVSILSGEAGAVMKGLEAAAGFLRGPLARRLRLRVAPELRFHHDKSQEMSSRLRDIVREDEAGAPSRRAPTHGGGRSDRRRRDGRETPMETELARAAEILATADKVMVTCHLGPDGDAVGSMVAMASLLRQRGAQVTLYNPDLVPRHIKWLPLCKGLVHRLPKSASFTATVVMDCGDPKLLGPDFPPPTVTGKLVVIDHHASGRPFGDVFLCDPDAASVGVLVARLAARLGWPITDDAAVALYVSLVTDTGSFRYANTNAEALRLAADLVERHNVGPWAVSERLSEQGTLGRYRLLAAALSTLEPVLGGHVVFMTITEEMVKGASAAWDDSEGMVNYAALDPRRRVRRPHHAGQARRRARVDAVQGPHHRRRRDLPGPGRRRPPRRGRLHPAGRPGRRPRHRRGGAGQRPQRGRRRPGSRELTRRTAKTRWTR